MVVVILIVLLIVFMQRLLLTAVLILFVLEGVRTEEASILIGATQGNFEIDTKYWSAAPLIDGNYKTRSKTNLDNNNGGRKEFQIILTETRQIVTIFVVNVCEANSKQKMMGRSHIWAGEDASDLSSDLT